MTMLRFESVLEDIKSRSNTQMVITSFDPGQQGQPAQDYTKAWEEYYKKQGGWPACGQIKANGLWPTDAQLTSTRAIAVNKT